MSEMQIALEYEISKLKLGLELALHQRDKYRACLLWHPISTAPKNRRILLAQKSPVYSRESVNWVITGWFGGDPEGKAAPTNWQELPEEWQFVEGEKDDA